MGEGRLRAIAGKKLGYILPGTEVRWRNQSQGKYKVKQGRVVDLVRANGDSYAVLIRHLGTLPPSSRMKFQRTSLVNRYLVEVPRETRSGGFDYYAPQMGVIHNQNQEKRAVLD